jgi:hypothetical protein
MRDFFERAGTPKEDIYEGLDENQRASVDALKEKLAQILEPEQIDEWIVRSVPALDGRRPIDAAIDNNPDDLQLIDDFIAGLKTSPTAG